MKLIHPPGEDSKQIGFNDDELVEILDIYCELATIFTVKAYIKSWDKDETIKLPDNYLNKKVYEYLKDNDPSNLLPVYNAIKACRLAYQKIDKKLEGKYAYDKYNGVI